MRPVLGALAKSAATTVVFFFAAEIALPSAYLVRNALVSSVPLPYTFGDNYGPTPPWLDRLQLLTDDPALIWRQQPNVRRTYLDIFSPVWVEEERLALLRRFNPVVPPEFRGNPTWDVRLNSEGFRGEDMSTVRRPATVRVACIGDSWTFGMPVGQDQTYPERLSVSEGLPVYLPIDTFGRVYMQGDHWHPDAAGYDAIARAVAREVINIR